MNKPFWKSKINWTAFIAVILGFLTDPAFTDFIDPFWAAQILKIAGGITFVISQWFTKRVPE